MATLNTKLQMIAQQTIQNKLKNVKNGNVAQTSLNNQTKTAVDEVKLTVVNSKSGFDKYVETLENGKKSVASSFINTLENYIGDFAKGIVSATQDEAPATKETKQANVDNTEQASANSILEENLAGAKDKEAEIDKIFDLQNKIQETSEKSYKYLDEGNNGLQSTNWANLKNKLKDAIDKNTQETKQNDVNNTEQASANSILEENLAEVKDKEAEIDKFFDLQNKIQETAEKSYKYLDEGNNGLQSTNWANLKGLKTAGISLGSTSTTDKSEATDASKQNSTAVKADSTDETTNIARRFRGFRR